MLLRKLKQEGTRYLPLEEEKKHIRRAQNGHQPSIDLLCSTLYWTVVEQAGKLAGPTTSDDMFDRLLASGVVAVLEAIHRFDLDSDAHLRTFALPRIRGTMLREISSEYSHLSIPHNAVGEAIKLADGATAGALGISEAKAQSLVEATQPATGLDDLQLEDNDQRFHFAVIHESILDALEPDEYYVVCLSYGIFGFPHFKRREIAELLGWSESQVSKTLETAVTALYTTLN